MVNWGVPKSLREERASVTLHSEKLCKVSFTCVSFCLGVHVSEVLVAYRRS